MFIVLRNQSEQTYARASKFSGRQGRIASIEAADLARFTRQAAQALRAAAESKGIWNETYVAEHGLGAWVR
jgi:hypothetical protein